MIIISKRSPQTLEWANAAADSAPNVWAHRRAMLWWRKLCAIDAETAQAALRTAPAGWHWIASWPLAIASVVNERHPDVFSDSTGRTMLRFLGSEEGAPYRVPGQRVVKAG